MRKNQKRPTYSKAQRKKMLVEAAREGLSSYAARTGVSKASLTRWRAEAAARGMRHPRPEADQQVDITAPLVTSEEVMQEYAPLDPALELVLLRRIARLAFARGAVTVADILPLEVVE